MVFVSDKLLFLATLLLLVSTETANHLKASETTQNHLPPPEKHPKASTSTWKLEEIILNYFQPT